MKDIYQRSYIQIPKTDLRDVNGRGSVTLRSLYAYNRDLVRPYTREGRYMPLSCQMLTKEKFNDV